jgi:hypothetical protein
MRELTPQMPCHSTASSALRRPGTAVYEQLLRELGRREPGARKANRPAPRE